MTDSNAHQSTPSNTTTTDSYTSRPSTDHLELEYPQLLLEASLHSLLTHSHSSEASTVLNMSQPGMPLSDSWASISDIDYAQEDDLQSENTDTGSLIDASSIQDIHSVNDSGDISESEEPEEQPLGLAASDFQHPGSGQNHSFVRQSHAGSTILRNSADTVSLESAQNSTQPDDLESSVDSIGSAFDHIGLASRFILPSEGFLHSYSTPPLDLDGCPLRILYLETRSVQADHKAAVLRKIGAALITSDSRHTNASNYHVIPSEFGPGASPETSELIPVTRQMAVHECALPSHSSIVNLSLVDGTPLVCSTTGIIIVEKGASKQRPDIILVITSEDDTEDEKEAINGTILYLRQFDTPILMVEERNPRFLPRTSRDKQSNLDLDAEKLTRSTTPMSIEQFITVDTDILYQSLSLLVENKRRRNGLPRIEHFFGAIQRTGEGWIHSLADFWRKVTKTTRDSAAVSMRSSSNIDVATRSFRQHWSSMQVASPAMFLMVIACSVILPTLFGAFYLTLNSDESIEIPPLSRHTSDTILVPPMTESAVRSYGKEATATPISKGTDISLLTGMLQDVAEYWPSHRSAPEGPRGRVKGSDEQPSEFQKGNECGTAATFVKLRKGEVLPVPEDFYRGGEAAFTVSINRGKRAVPFKLEDVGHGRQLIKVDNDEVHGLLKVLFSSNGKSGSRICAYIDLRDTPVEKLARIIAQGHKKKKGGLEGTPRPWTLIRTRRTTSRRNSVFQDASQYAMKTVETAHAVIEEKTLAQIVACHNHADDCWLRKARKYQRKLLTLAHECEEEVVGIAAKARDRAQVLVSEAITRSDSILRTITPEERHVQKLLTKMKSSHNKLAAKLMKKTGKAQRRARKLLQARHRR